MESLNKLFFFNDRKSANISSFVDITITATIKIINKEICGG
jgi:hypothetical protein